MDRRTTAAYVLSAGLIAATGAGALVATAASSPRQAPTPLRCATSSRPPSSPGSSTSSTPLPRLRPPAGAEEAGPGVAGGAHHLRDTGDQHRNRRNRRLQPGRTRPVRPSRTTRPGRCLTPQRPPHRPRPRTPSRRGPRGRARDGARDRGPAIGSRGRHTRTGTTDVTSADQADRRPRSVAGPTGRPRHACSLLGSAPR